MAYPYDFDTDPNDEDPPPDEWPGPGPGPDPGPGPAPNPFQTTVIGSRGDPFQQRLAGKSDVSEQDVIKLFNRFIRSAQNNPGGERAKWLASTRFGKSGIPKNAKIGTAILKNLRDSGLLGSQGSDLLKRFFRRKPPGPGPDPGPGPGPGPSPGPGPGSDGVVPGPDTSIPGVPINDLGAPQFDDPGTAILEDLAKARLNELFSPVNDPARQQLSDLLQTLTDRYGQPLRNPEVDAQIAKIRERIGALDDPFLGLGDYESRVEELQGPVFSASDENLLRTQSLDRIARQQDEEEARALEVFGGLGRERSSGVNAEILNQLGQFFSGQRAEAEGEFARYAIDERQKRQDQAINLLDRIRSITDRRADQSLQLGEGIRQLEEGELTRADTRALQQTGFAEALAQLTQGTRQEEQQRRREGLSIAGLLSDLPANRLQLALATLGTQPPPPPLFGQLAQLLNAGQGQGQLGLGLAGLQNQGALINQNANQQFQGGLGSFLAGLGNLFPGSSSSPTYFDEFGAPTVGG